MRMRCRFGIHDWTTWRACNFALYDGATYLCTEERQIRHCGWCKLEQNR